MANSQQFKFQTLYVGTRGVKEYRASISEYISSQDKVLEVGCQWGTTSKFIAPKCEILVATDINKENIDRAKEMHKDIDFRVLDVFNIQDAMAYSIDFNKMYIDVSGLSGYRSLLDVISLLDMYASVFNMDAIVIKSGALKNFARRCKAWRNKA
jgi:hypothetical protein